MNEIGNITFERVAGSLGAIVGGLDLKEPMPSETVSCLGKAMAVHGVLFFRDQVLDLDQFWAFTKNFGTPLSEEVKGTPQDTPDMVGTADMAPVRHSTAVWHADTTSLANPPWATALRAVQPTPFGGDTCWSSMYAAWDALSEPVRRMLDGLTAIHSIQPTYDRMLGYVEYFRPEYAKRHKAEQVHPVVLTHPVTGRKALYVSESFTTRILELTLRESASILDMLFRQVARPEFCVRWKWSANDMAFWDNRCVQHYAVPDYETARIMQRIVLQG
jgi:alpha-ketoglutarate-dependent taurine dioxygenase